MVSIEKTEKVKIDYSFFVRLVIENHTVIYKQYRTIVMKIID